MILIVWLLMDAGQSDQFHDGSPLWLQVKEKNAAGVEELQTVHRYAPNSGTDSCFGEISLVSGAKPYGGNIIARSAGAAL